MLSTPVMDTSIYSATLLDGNGEFSTRRFRKSFGEALQKWGFPTVSFGNKGIFVDDDEDPTPSTTRSDEEESVICVEKNSLVVDDDDDDEEVKPAVPKLKLVLDLDNTLLQAYAKAKLKDCEIKLGDFLDSQGSPEMYKFSLPQAKSPLYYVKFRPGIREFLRELQPYCDFAIHTNATREYADVMICILDEDRKYFGQRVAAREEAPGREVRKDMERLFEACSSAVSDGRDLLIVDDRRDVWDDSLFPNLIQCSFYDFFDSRKKGILSKYGGEGCRTPNTTPNGSPVNNAVVDAEELMSVPRLTEDEAAALSTGESLVENDLQLVYIKSLIIRVAEEFQRRWRCDPNSTSVDAILEAERRNILSGVSVLLTGFNKIDVPSDHGNLDSGPLHKKRLLSLGAKVVENPNENFTHVLVMRNTTTVDTIRKSKGDSVKYVHALWLSACEVRWSRVCEDSFDPAVLLKKYEERPPVRPQIEQWSVTVGGGGGGGAAEDAAASEENSSPTASSVSSASRTPATASLELVEKEWLAGGPSSDGVQVWSPTEHTMLRFDPVRSSQLAHKLRRKAQRRAGEDRHNAINSVRNLSSETSVANLPSGGKRKTTSKFVPDSKRRKISLSQEETASNSWSSWGGGASSCSPIETNNTNNDNIDHHHQPPWSSHQQSRMKFGHDDAPWR